MTQVSGREQMLARIRTALGREGGASEPPPLPPGPPRAGRVEPRASVEQFRTELEEVGGRVSEVSSTAEVMGYLETLLSSRVISRAAVSDGAEGRARGLRGWLGARGLNVTPSFGELASRIRKENATPGGDGVVTGEEEALLFAEYKRALFEAELGVTCADYALAETGTLVLVSGGEQHRLISLLPPVHVCLLDAHAILPRAADLYEALRPGPQSVGPPHAAVLITGPSRTADIEQTLTVGVHGPKELHVLVDVSLPSAEGRHPTL